MIILTIRTDKPESEIGLFNDHTELSYEIWLAHRQLAETLHTKINALLNAQDLAWSSVDAVLVYKGPGSFTGLRIGLSVANALASGNDLAVVAANGANWIDTGLSKLLAGNNDTVALPDYGAPVHITAQKK